MNYMQYLFISHKLDAVMVEETETDAASRIAEKYIKKIRKSMKVAEYEVAVNGLFRECDIREGASFEG